MVKIITMRALLPEGIEPEEFYDAMNHTLRDGLAVVVHDWAYRVETEYDIPDDYEEGEFLNAIE